MIGRCYRYAVPYANSWHEIRTTSSGRPRLARVLPDRAPDRTGRHTIRRGHASVRPAVWLECLHHTGIVMPITRRAAPADAARLATLAERTFRAAFGACNTRENMDAHCASAYGEAIQASEITNPGTETFVCDDGTELIGYAQLRWGTRAAVRTGVEACRNPAHLRRTAVARPRYRPGTHVPGVRCRSPRQRRSGVAWRLGEQSPGTGLLSEIRVQQGRTSCLSTWQ